MEGCISLRLPCVKVCALYFVQSFRNISSNVIILHGVKNYTGKVVHLIVVYLFILHSVY